LKNPPRQEAVVAYLMVVLKRPRKVNR